MILSMTGYGKASGKFNGKNIQIGIRSLNGKTTDIRIKAPNNYREKEIDLRNLILKDAHRGKMDVQIDVDAGNGEDDYALNKALFKHYFRELTNLKEELNYTSEEDLFAGILRIPNVVVNNESSISDEEWSIVKQTALEAVKNLNSFRSKEGEAMHKDLVSNVDFIQSSLTAILPHEGDRIENLRKRLSKNLNEFLSNGQVDQNRFEQEVLFYVEKLDINEEKVRLEQHCKFFHDVIGGVDFSKGKKLSFISQEMGREINTLGAKAQHSEIQQIVVSMKDALEQIKEQLANVV